MLGACVEIIANCKFASLVFTLFFSIYAEERASVNPLAQTARRYLKQFMKLPNFEHKQPTLNPLHTASTAFDKENEIVATRVEKTVKPALKKLLPESKRTPCVCLMGSGGGARAAIATAGSIIGLQEAGLLDTCSYFCGLSGSTWAASVWYGLGLNPEDIEQAMRSRFVANDQLLARVNLKKIVQQHCAAFAYEQPTSLGTLWGYIIYDMLFGSSARAPVVFDDLLPHIESGAYPYPIFTASLLVNSANKSSFECFEFSPDKAGSRYLSTWVDSKNLGHRFNAGQFQGGAPQLDMASMLGIVSCAYAVSKSDLKEHLPQIKCAIKEYLGTLVNNSLAYRLTQFAGDVICRKIEFDVDNHSSTRVSPPHIANFAYRLSSAPTNVQNSEKLCLIDQGISGQNVPFNPMIDRHADVYFVFDASKTQNLRSLKAAERYAQEHGNPFPSIDCEKIIRKAREQGAVLIHDKYNSAAPVIVYVPNVEQSTQFATTKFTYTHAEFNALIGYFKKSVIKNKDLFLQALKIAAEKF